MNKKYIRKVLLIIPSSIFFFLLVPLVSILFGKHLDRLLGSNYFQFGFIGLLVSITLLLIGTYYVLESIRLLFVQGGGIPLGDVLQKDQTEQLITTGVYSHTRNPMLFGYLLCFIAIGLLMNSISIALVIPVFFTAIWTIWLKKWEEPALEERFGEEYTKYKKEVTYLIPRLWRKA